MICRKRPQRGCAIKCERTSNRGFDCRVDSLGQQLGIRIPREQVLFAHRLIEEASLSCMGIRHIM